MTHPTHEAVCPVAAGPAFGLGGFLLIWVGCAVWRGSQAVVANPTALAGGCCRLWAPPFFVLSLLWWWCWFPSPCLLGGMGAVAPAGGDCGGAPFDRAGATAPATGVGCHRRLSWFLSVWVFYFPRSLNARATGFCDPCTF